MAIRGTATFCSAPLGAGYDLFDKADCGRLQCKFSGCGNTAGAVMRHSRCVIVKPLECNTTHNGTVLPRSWKPY